MALPQPPEKAIFFVAILAAGRSELALAARALTDEFGSALCGSPIWPFTQTEYYRRELGDAPLRAFLAFPGPFHCGRLAERKLISNRMEIDIARRIDGPLPRPVNLDPGYLTHAKLILASAKNFGHRIYLSDGIYAEVTLQYRHGRFQTLPWTFPDYASPAYHGFFHAVRETLKLLP